VATKKKKMTTEELKQKRLGMHAQLRRDQIIMYLLRSFMFEERGFYEVRRVPWSRVKKVKWDKITGFVRESFTGYNTAVDLGRMRVSVSAAIKPYLNMFSRLRCGIDLKDFPEFYDKEFIPMNLRNTFLTMLQTRGADVIPAAMAYVQRNEEEGIILRLIHMPNYMMKRFCMARKKPVPIYGVAGYDLKENLYDALTDKGRKGDVIDKGTKLYNDDLMRKRLHDLKKGLFSIPVSVLTQAFERMGPFRLLTTGGTVYFVRKEVIGSSFEVPEADEKPLSSKSKEDFRFTEAWTVTVMGDAIDEYSIGLDIPCHFKGTFRELWTMFGTMGAMKENAQNKVTSLQDGKGKEIHKFVVTPEMIHLVKAVVFVLSAVKDPETVVSKYKGKSDGGTAADFINKSECSGKKYVLSKADINPVVVKIIKDDRPSWYKESKGDISLTHAFYTDEEDYVDKVKSVQIIREEDIPNAKA